MNNTLKCSLCLSNIPDSSLFCPKCGKSTNLLTVELNARKNIMFCIKNFKIKDFKISAFILVLIFLSNLLPFYLFEKFYLEMGILTFLLPFALIPLSKIKDSFLNYKLSDYQLSKYPTYLIFSVLNFSFFILLKIITTGIDPILNLVFLIMSFYWISIMLPVPHLIGSEKSLYNAMKISLLEMKETRWQQFFTLIFLIVFNFVGLLTFGIGLFITVPLSYRIVQRYSQILIKIHKKQ